MCVSMAVETLQHKYSTVSGDIPTHYYANTLSYMTSHDITLCGLFTLHYKLNYLDKIPLDIVPLLNKLCISFYFTSRNKCPFFVPFLDWPSTAHRVS